MEAMERCTFAWYMLSRVSSTLDVTHLAFDREHLLLVVGVISVIKVAMRPVHVSWVALIVNICTRSDERRPKNKSLTRSAQIGTDPVYSTMTSGMQTISESSPETDLHEPSSAPDTT